MLKDEIKKKQIQSYKRIQNKNNNNQKNEDQNKNKK
jgi:hypothetical protein